MSKKTPYVFIPESCGGTLTLTTTKRIGTSNCISCVGLYLPLSPTRCFAAHINVFVKVHIEGPGGWRRISVNLRREEGEAIQREVKRRLEETAEKEGWSREDFAKYGKKAVVVCPALGKGDRPGVWVIRGVEEFLGNGVDLMRLCRQDKQGFVVNHEDGGVVYVENSSAGEEEEKRAFERVEARMEENGWKVSGGRWMIDVRRDMGLYADRLIFGKREDVR